MAPSASATILFRVAPGTVWKGWLNLPAWRDWDPEVRESAWLSGAPWQVGSTFTLLRRTPYRALDRVSGANARRFTGRVLSVAEEQLLVWELTPTTAAWFGPTLVESVRLSPAPGGTNVSVTLTAHGLGPTLFAFLLGGPLSEQAQATLRGFQRHLAPAERRQ